MKARVARVVPEPDRDRGEGPRTNQFALSVPDRFACVVEDGDRHAESRALDLAAPDRQRRATSDEARDDVGAAGDRGESHVGFYARVDVIEALRSQRRAGRKQRLQRRQIVAACRLEILLRHRVEKLGGNAHDIEALALGQIEERAGAGLEGGAVVEHQARAAGQAGGQPVPHHPAAGRVVEEARVGAQSGVELVLFQMLQERSAGAVDDALRWASGSR